jgi:hypothetical protein
VASLKDVKLDPSLAVAVVPNAAPAYLALTESARMRDGERILPDVLLSEVSETLRSVLFGREGGHEGDDRAPSLSPVARNPEAPDPRPHSLSARQLSMARDG